MEQTEPTIRSPELRKSLDDLAVASQKYEDVLCHNQREIRDFLTETSNALLYSVPVCLAATYMAAVVYFSN